MINDTLQQQLGDALDYLVQLGEEATKPEEAKARLRLLPQRYPDTAIELLWEEQKYDQSVHYGLLLRSDKKPGTISLSFCPDRVLPWPLRSVHRWDEADLVRVNTTILRMDQAIACLDFIWDDACTDRLINTCLIQEALDREPAEISEEELQEAMDGFRRAHRLYRAEDTLRWMKQRGMTHEQFERYVTNEAMVVKLRDRVATDGHVEAYFADHHADFDLAYLAQIILPDAENANLLYQQMQSGLVDFYEAAQRHFLTKLGKKEIPHQGLFTTIRRRQVPLALRESIFAAAPDMILGPVHTDENYTIVRVLLLTPARLNDQMRREIKELLFDTWLAERWQAANIEWYWGNAGRTLWID